MAEAASAQRSLKRAVILVLVYYALTLGALLMVMFAFPAARDFLPVGGLDNLTSEAAFTLGAESLTPVSPLRAANVLGRAVALLSSLIGTLVFIAPVAWVYSRTRQGKHTASLIETLILLPIVVAIVLAIVKNSVALAFSLFGIVAAVRFRSDLKNPSDGVFVFAALSVGLAAGVSEIGVAGVGSMVFCVTVLCLRIFKTAA